MPTATSKIQETQLLSYVIASSDMRYIEVNRRNIFLRDDPALGLVLRGEIPECAPASAVDLAFMLLEYAMSCQDCHDRPRTAAAVDHFGAGLGRALIDQLEPETLEGARRDQLQATFAIVLRSLNVPFSVDVRGQELHYSLSHCPFHETAAKTALNLQVAMAHRALVALCDALLAALAPDWTLVQPAERETEAPLLEIVFRQGQLIAP